jgi:hypothetical protein
VLAKFSLLLDCLKHYNLPFPSRTQFIAEILNKSFPTAKQVTKFQVFNVIDKIKQSDLGSKTDQCLTRPSIATIASSQNALYIAFPQPSTCIFCSKRLEWIKAFLFST